MLHGTPLQAFGRFSGLDRLRMLEGDRVLVLIQLSGGNDGLNTVVPYRNDIYYSTRPTLGIPKNKVLPLTDDYGLHAALAPFEPLWGDGHLAIIQGVGYPDPNLSHFISTDMWARGGSEDTVGETGWAGRYLDGQFPDFELKTENGDDPLAIQIGAHLPHLFQGPGSNLGISVTNPEIFVRLANWGRIFDPDAVPPTPHGTELSFVRTVANSALNYAGAIQKAASQGKNQTDYPIPGNILANYLSIVARLIKGGLKTRVFVVTIPGFDTHSNQLERHHRLLTDLALATRAFYDDLASDGQEQRVLTMTFSEFGRRVDENASRGTDHGTAAPMFILGNQVNGGLYGTAPALDDLDSSGNLNFSTDFRSVYGSMLGRWFGLPSDEVANIFGAAYPRLDFLSAQPSPTPTSPDHGPDGFSLKQN